MSGRGGMPGEFGAGSRLTVHGADLVAEHPRAAAHRHLGATSKMAQALIERLNASRDGRGSEGDGADSSVSISSRGAGRGGGGGRGGRGTGGAKAQGSLGDAGSDLGSDDVGGGQSRGDGTAWRTDPNHGLSSAGQHANAEGFAGPQYSRSKKTRREMLWEQKRMEALLFADVRHSISDESLVPIAQGSTTRLGPAYGTSYYDGVGIMPTNLGSGAGQGVKREAQPSESVARNSVQLRSRGERGAAFRHVDLFKENAGWAPG